MIAVAVVAAAAVANPTTFVAFRLGTTGGGSIFANDTLQPAAISTSENAWPTAWPDDAAAAVVNNTAYIFGNFDIASVLCVRATPEGVLRREFDQEPFNNLPSNPHFEVTTAPSTLTPLPDGYSGTIFVAVNSLIAITIYECTAYDSTENYALSCAERTPLRLKSSFNGISNQYVQRDFKLVHYNQKLWIIGGIYCDEQTTPTCYATSSTFVLPDGETAWEAGTSPLTSGLADFSIMVVDGRIVIVGGSDGSSNFNREAFIFNGTHSTATNLESMGVLSSTSALQSSVRAVATGCNSITLLIMEQNVGKKTLSFVGGVAQPVFGIQTISHFSANWKIELITFEVPSCASLCVENRAYWGERNPPAGYPIQFPPSVYADCVPTAAGNLLTKLTMDMAVGPGNYPTNNHLDALALGDNFYEITQEGTNWLNHGHHQHLTLFGGAHHPNGTRSLYHLMQTDSLKGTYIENARLGLQQYLDNTKVLGDYEVVSHNRSSTENDMDFIKNIPPPFLLHISPLCVQPNMWEYNENDEYWNVESLTQTNFDDPPLGIRNSQLGHTIVVYVSKPYDSNGQESELYGASGRNYIGKRTCAEITLKVTPSLSASQSCIVGTTAVAPTPTAAPTSAPTAAPTLAPTPPPTPPPTNVPTSAPTPPPTASPTAESSDTGTIVGGVVGGAFALGALGYAGYAYKAEKWPFGPKLAGESFEVSLL